MQAQTKLGIEMQSSVYALKGRIDEERGKEIQAAVIEAVRMQTGGIAPQTWTFPINDLGGVGYTLIQPLVESYSGVVLPAGVVGVDAWSEHQGFFLIINSCRPFSVGKVYRVLTRKLGLKVVDADTSYVSLQPAKKSWLRRLIGG